MFERQVHSIEDGEDLTSCKGTNPAVSFRRISGDKNSQIPNDTAASSSLGDATSSETFASLGEVAFVVLLRCSSARLKWASGELRGTNSPLVPARS